MIIKILLPTLFLISTIYWKSFAAAPPVHQKQLQSTKIKIIAPTNATKVSTPKPNVAKSTIIKSTINPNSTITIKTNDRKYIADNSTKRKRPVTATNNIRTTNKPTGIKPTGVKPASNITKQIKPKPIKPPSIKPPAPKASILKKRINFYQQPQVHTNLNGAYNEINEPWMRSQITSSARSVMNTCDCGKRNNDLRLQQTQTGRIINGYNTMLHEYPWQTYLMAIENRQTVIVNGQTRYNFNFKSCGGSIINDLFILTAAHCLVDEKPGHSRRVKSVSDITGKLMIKNTDDKNAMEIKVEKIIIHPGYLAYKPMHIGVSVVSHRYDIALLKLTERLNLVNDPRLKPICIPETGDYILINEGVMAKVVGWGYTNRGHNSRTAENLMQVNIPMHNSSTCSKYSGDNAHRFVCGEELNRETGAAQGDSGGPLCIQMGTDPDKMIQIGVVSFTNTGSFHNSNGVVTEKYSLGYYSDVQSFIPFIDFHSKQAGANWCQRRYSINKK